LKLPFSAYVKRHHVSHAALSLAAVAAAVVFFVVGAFIRLLVGPVSLGPLQQTLAGAIQQALPGITLVYDKAAIEWDRDQNRVELVVLGARILDRDGRIVATAPKADIQLAAGPLLEGKVAVQRITLVGVNFSLIYLKTGGIRLGTEGGAANDVYERLSDLITAKSSDKSTLKSFAVRNANLKMFDEVTGLNLTAPRANLSITAQKDASLATGFEADVMFAGEPKPQHSTHVKADLILPASDKAAITGTALVEHLDLSALSANAPLFRPLHLLALATDLTTKFSIEPGGRITETDFDLKAKGDIPFEWLTAKALNVRELRLTGHYDGVTKHVSLNDARLDARQADLTFKGGADMVYANGELESVSADIATTRAVLNMTGVLPQPVTLQSAAFKATYHADEKSIDIARLSITAPQFNLDVKGQAQFNSQPGQAPGLNLTGSIAQIPVRQLLRYWPLQVAPGAREWIDLDIFAGTMGPIAFETHFAPGMLDMPVLPDDSMLLTFDMNGVEGNYLDGLTHVVNVSGNAKLTGDNFEADFFGGKVGNLNVTKGHALIPALHVHGTVGQFTAHIDGPMPDIMALIDLKPLQYPTKFGIDPKTTLGTAAVNLAVQVPMLAHNADKIGILVKAHVNEFAVALGRLHLTNGDVDFTVENNTMHQAGVVQLADTKLNVDWVEDLNSTSPITTHLTVRGPVTEAARAALNVGLTTILTGPVPTQGTLTGSHGSLRTADLNLDLTPAAILVPIVHLGKPAGQAASARVTINFGQGNNLQDETLRITGPNLSANGNAYFDKNGALTQLNFPSVKMGTLNDLSFVLARNQAGDTYTVRGRSMDGSLMGRNGDTKPGAPGVNASAPPPNETPAGPYRIDARLERLAMRDNVFIAPFNLDLSGFGEKPGTLSLSGTLTSTGSGARSGENRSGAITGSITPTATGRQFNLQAADAGLLLRGLFAFDSMRGGKMVLDATLPGRASDPPVPANQPDYTGKLDITDFTMLNQSFLSRLFSAGSLVGVGDLLGGQGISVDKLDVPFTSKNNVISIHDSIVSGPAVGGTAEGYIDRPKNMVALKGSMVPAYGLNSIISNVPLLGDLLASKKGEGIIGVTYSATGSADEPVISVNPLSALTPGILRRIFQGNMPNAANAPTNKEEGAAPPATPPPPASQSNAAPRPAQ
jgi:hypothetical protein